MEQGVGEAGACIDQVLAVIEEQQELALAERRADLINDGPPRLFTDVHGRGNCPRNACRIGDGRQLDQPHPIGITVEDSGGEVEGEPGLAAAARTGQR